MASRTERGGESLFSSQWRRQFRRRVLAWYRRHARELPWREDSDAYRIWVSEIMLQQTQVATVEPYFRRFVAAFPDVHALAAADPEQVLRLWEGLGYYRRARQLHRAAVLIESEHDGRFPRERQTLERLPGIGRYTAGAILSIAYDQREPVLEANTTRLLSRLLAIEEDVTRTATQKKLWQAATEVLPRKNAGALNQALMELGSQVCTPREPHCPKCPVAPHCRAFAIGRQQEIPPPKPQPKIEQVHEAAVVVRRRGRVLLLERREGERFAGLWDFPRFEIRRRRGASLRRELAENVRELTGVDIEAGQRFATLRHGVTRFRITLYCHEAECVAARRGKAPRRLKWITLGQLDALPLSTTGRKISRLIGG